MRREGGKLNNLFFAPGVVKRLKTQEGIPKTNPFLAKTNPERTRMQQRPDGGFWIPKIAG
jgi:hypothetical protein